MLIKANKWVLLFLATLVFIVYLNSLPNGFVSDDRGIILHAHELNYAFSYEPLASFRPILNFITYQFAGLNPLAYRFINVLFHIGTVWLIFFLLTILSGRTVAIVAASIFAVHPIVVESVTWISGGTYIQYSFFFLLTFITYIFAKQNSKLYGISLIAFMFSLWSSEKAVVLPLIFPLYELLLGDVRKHWKKSLPFFLISGIFTFLYLGKLGQRASGLESFQGEKIFYNPLIQIPVAITSYLELIFWPNKLTLYHSETIYTVIEYIVRLTLFVGIVVATIASLKYTRQIFFWFVFFTITLLPTLNPFGLTWIVAERYVYLGSLGILVILALCLVYFTKRAKAKVFIYTALVIVIALLSIRTMVRNLDWRNEDTLWLSAARTSPSSAQNHNNLGDLYGRRGDRQRAILEFKEAIRLKPNYADAYHNLGNTYVELGKIDEAIESYQKAISFNPGLVQSYQNLAAIYVSLKDFDKALEYAKKAIEANPRDPNLLINLGIIYLQAGEKDEAKELILKVLSVDPQNPRANEVLKLLQQQ